MEREGRVRLEERDQAQSVPRRASGFEEGFFLGGGGGEEEEGRLDCGGEELGFLLPLPVAALVGDGGGADGGLLRLLLVDDDAGGDEDAEGGGLFLLMLVLLPPPPLTDACKGRRWWWWCWCWGGGKADGWKAPTCVAETRQSSTPAKSWGRPRPGKALLILLLVLRGVVLVSSMGLAVCGGACGRKSGS